MIKLRALPRLSLKFTVALGLIAFGQNMSPLYIPSEVAVNGNRFVRADNGQEVVLRSINWEGFNTDHHMLHGLEKKSFRELVDQLKELNFNSVRIPFSNGLLRIQSGHFVPAAVYEKNSDLEFMRHNNMVPREVMATMVDRLTAEGFYVILDNHQSDLQYYQWEKGGMWFDENTSEEQWVEDWDFVAWRFRDNSRVIGYELRNEVRPALMKERNPVTNQIVDQWYVPVWGVLGYEPEQYPESRFPGRKYKDWRAATQLAIDKIWRRNPHKIVFLGGLNLQFDLSFIEKDGAYFRELRNLPNASNDLQLAYSVHVYGWLGASKLGDRDWNSAWWLDGTWRDLIVGREPASRSPGARNVHDGFTRPEQHWIYDQLFGYLKTAGQFYTGPIWISEFGTNDLAEFSNTTDVRWFRENNTDVRREDSVTARFQRWQAWSYTENFRGLVDYIHTRNMSFAYYSIGNYYPKQLNSPIQCDDDWSVWYRQSYIKDYEKHCDTYGLFNRNWNLPNPSLRDWRFHELAKILR